MGKKAAWSAGVVYETPWRKWPDSLTHRDAIAAAGTPRGVVFERMHFEVHSWIHGVDGWYQCDFCPLYPDVFLKENELGMYPTVTREG